MIRLKQLDFLRGIAVLLVLFHHIFELSGSSLPIYLHWIKYIGWAGVDLFFVLSGFLISGLLFKESQKRNDLDIKRFYVRRVFKILPSFYFLLLAFAMIHLLVPLQIGQYSLKSFISELLFLQNYKGGVFSHTWTLSVEEHFYLFLPVFTWLIFKFGKPTFFPYYVFSLIVLVIVVRNTTINVGDPRFPFYSHNRIDSLLVGVFISYFYHYQTDSFTKRVKKSSLILSLLSMASLTYFLSFHYMSELNLRIGFDIISIAWAVLLVVLLCHYFPPNNWVLKAITSVGLYSYNIYLWHDVVNHLAFHYLFSEQRCDYWEYVIIYLAGSVFLGVMLTKCIEEPFIHLRQKKFSS
jgi:peptidoglycan/LPS O-acetylase OafA/YrhL